MENNGELELPGYVEKHATRNNPDSVLRTIDEYAVNEAPQKWMMNISVPKGYVLDDQVNKVLSRPPADPNRGYVFVEMGYYVGYSTVRIARQFKALNKKATLYSFDPDADAFKITSRILAFAGLTEYVKLVSGTVTDALPKEFAELNIKKIDFAFIDHDKRVYLPDFKLLERHDLFHVGSIVLADNLLYPGSGDYYFYARQHKKFRSQLVISKLEYSDIEDALLISEYTG